MANAQVDVIISGGFSGPYEKLLPEFERVSGVKVKTGSGASQGKGPQTIAAQLARGVHADVVILSREGLDDLIKSNRIAPGTDLDLANVPVGVAVRTGAARPDVGSVEAVKRMLLAARSIAVPGSTSGIWMVEDLFPRLGLAGKLPVKMTPRGADAAAAAASGEADIALLPVSEILHAPGVEHAGTLPDEIQFVQTFSAAIVAGSTQVESARRLIAHLSAPAAADVIRKSGLTPISPKK